MTPKNLLKIVLPFVFIIASSFFSELFAVSIFAVIWLYLLFNERVSDYLLFLFILMSVVLDVLGLNVFGVHLFALISLTLVFKLVKRILPENKVWGVALISFTSLFVFHYFLRVVLGIEISFDLNAFGWSSVSSALGKSVIDSIAFLVVFFATEFIGARVKSDRLF